MNGTRVITVKRSTDDKGVSVEIKPEMQFIKDVLLAAQKAGLQFSFCDETSVRVYTSDQAEAVAPYDTTACDSMLPEDTLYVVAHNVMVCANTRAVEGVCVPAKGGMTYRELVETAVVYNPDIQINPTTVVFVFASADPEYQPIRHGLDELVAPSDLIVVTAL